MPQASDELRQKWGGERGIGEDKAIGFLELRGYSLTKRFCWLPPVGHIPTPEEEEAALFLMEEWDYGPILCR